MGNPDFDWQRFYFSGAPPWCDVFRKAALRRFRGDEALSEQAFNFAESQLSADGFAQLRGQVVSEKPERLLITAFYNNLENFSRSHFGRPRPPAWVERAGELHVRIFRMLCTERQMVQSIVDWCVSRRNLEPETVRKIVRDLGAKIPSCGARIVVVASGDGEEPTAPVTAEPLWALEQQELATACEALRVVTGSLEPTEASVLSSTADLAIWRDLLNRVEIGDEARLILRMTFVDKLKYAESARRLGRTPKQVERSVKTALELLREALESAGVTD